MSNLNLSELETKLLADPHIIALHLSEYSEFPKIDYRLWRGPKSAEKEVNYLHKYLSENYVVDNFGEDHDGRNEWIIGKDKETRKYLNNSPLRPNIYSGIYLLLRNMLFGYRGTHKNQLERSVLNDLLNGYPKDYHHFPTAGKIRLVDETKRKVYGILEFLSKQKPVSQKPYKSL